MAKSLSTGARLFAAIFAMAVVLSLAPLTSYAATGITAAGGGTSKADPALSAQSLKTQDADEVTIGGTTAAVSNAGNYGASAYGNTASWENGFVETLYLSSEIGSSPLKLTSLSYYVTTNSANKWTNAAVKIYLAETSSSSLSSYNDLVGSDNAVLVYEGTTTLGVDSASWQTFEFNKAAFTYSGTKNLAVIFMATGGERATSAVITASQSNSGKGWSFFDDKNADSFANYATLKSKIQSIGSAVDNNSYKSGANTYRPSIKFGYTTPTSYALTANSAEHGNYTVKVDEANATTAYEGATVTINATGDEGYTVDTVTVTGADGNSIEIARSGNVFTFKMPSQAVTISVTFKEGEAEITDTFANNNVHAGTESDPYIISTEADLIAFRDAINGDKGAATYTDKYFEMAADIKLTNGWVPIGYSTDYYFDGHFDGKYHTVSNVTSCIPPSGNYHGFFGYVRAYKASADVKNLRVIGSENSTIDIDASASTGKYVGGLVAYTGSSESYSLDISNCITNINLSSVKYAGGIIGGGCARLTISDCLALGNIVPKDYSTATKSVTNVSGGCGGLVGNWSTATDSSLNTSLFAGQIATTDMGKDSSYTGSGTWYKTQNALVGKMSSTTGVPTLNNALFVAQADKEVGAYRAGGSTIVEPEKGTPSTLTTSEEFAAAQTALGDGWVVDGTKIAPKSFAPEAGYVVESSAATKYKVSFVDEDGTTVLKDEAEYDEGTKVSTIKPADPSKQATAEYAYEFSGWDPAINETTTVTKDQTYKATYTQTKKQYTPTLADTSNGTASLSSTGAIDWGTEVTVTATPDEGYELDAITVKDSSSNNIAVTDGTFTMPASDVAVTVTFKKKTYTITWSVEGATTTTNVEHGATPAYEGATPTKADDAQYSYTFDAWSPTLVAAIEDATYTATFTGTKKQYTPTLADTSNGTASLNTTGAIDWGTAVTVTATPGEGYELDSITVTGPNSETVTVTDRTFTMPTYNVTVAVAFKEKQATPAEIAAADLQAAKDALTTAANAQQAAKTAADEAASAKEAADKATGADERAALAATAVDKAAEAQSKAETAQSAAAAAVSAAQKAVESAEASGDDTAKTEANSTLSSANEAKTTADAAVTAAADAKTAADTAKTKADEAKAAADKEAARIDVAKATVTVASATYNGQKLTPAVTVKVGSTTLKQGTDYTLAYANNVAASSKASVTVTGTGAYKGTATKTFAIAKASKAALGKAVSIKASAKSVKASKLKKKARTVASPFKVTKKAAAKSGTTVTFAKVKKGTSKQLTKINKKTGKITVKKGTKKGTYKMKVKVTVKNPNYQTYTKTVTVKVKVK